MVTVDGEIQQRFPGYLFLARKRLLKKRTPKLCTRNCNELSDSIVFQQI